MKRIALFLGTNIADPRERLAAVRESTHQSKEFNKAIDARTERLRKQLLGEDGRMYRLGAAHADPTKEPLLLTARLVAQ